MLNATLGYFMAVVAVSAFVRVLLARWKPQWRFLLELVASFSLSACWLEIQTISEIGQWAGGLGPDVTLTMLFLAIVIHGAVMLGVTGNPSLTLMGFLQKEAGAVDTILSVAGQLAGAHLGLLVAGWYWAMELTDMHMIKNLMMAECSTSLRVPVVQGVFAETISALTFHLVGINLRHRSQWIQIPIKGLLITFLYYVGSNYTSGYVNPSLAYAITFACPGHTFLEYSLVYWLGPFIGMTLAIFLYMGNIPLLFNKNLLYSKKGRARVPKGKNTEEKKSK